MPQSLLKRFSILLLAPPGSGKSTLGRYLQSQFPEMTHISTGDIIREALRSGEYPQLAEFVALGECAPKELTDSILLEKMKLLPRDNIWLLDGYPREMGQIAEAEDLYFQLERRVDLVLHFPFSRDEELVCRMMTRTVCSECGRNKGAGKNEQLCPKRMGEAPCKWTERVDGSREVCEARLARYRKEEGFLVSHFQERNSLIKMDWKEIQLDLSSGQTQTNRYIWTRINQFVYENSVDMARHELLATHLPHSWDASRDAILIAPHFRCKVYQFLEMALEENLGKGKRSGMLRRFVLCVTNSKHKMSEYEKFFDLYGVETIQLPLSDVEADAPVEVGDFARFISYVFQYYFEELSVHLNSMNAKCIGLFRETSGLFKSGASVENSKLRWRAHLDRDTDVVNLCDLFYHCFIHRTGKQAPICEVESGFFTVTQGGELRKLDASLPAKSSVPGTFGWDARFKPHESEFTIAEFALYFGYKNSSRQNALSYIARKLLHYTKPRSLSNENSLSTSEIKSAIDFRFPVKEFFKQNRFLQGPNVRKAGIISMIERVIQNGLFFKASFNRRQANYWQPGLNAGLPFTLKSDGIHEITYMIHDCGHFLMPDLLFTGRDSPRHKSIYVAYRMMSEAITMVLADILFVEALKRDIESGYLDDFKGYDWSKRRIHPLYVAASKRYPLFDANGSFNPHYLNMYLRANVQFVLKGDSGPWKALLHGEDEQKLFDDFADKYVPFFLEDYRWTTKNYENMVKAGVQIKTWWSEVLPVTEGLDLQLLDDWVSRFHVLEQDTVDLMFQMVWKQMIAPVFMNIQCPIVEAPTAISAQMEELRSTKNAVSRWLCGQLALPARFLCSNPGLRHLFDETLRLHKNLLLAENKSSLFDFIHQIQFIYERILRLLHKSAIICEDDVVTYSSVYPMFPPFFVSYEQLKHSEDYSAEDLKRNHETHILTPSVQLTRLSSIVKDEKQLEFTKRMAALVLAAGGEMEDEIFVSKPGIGVVARTEPFLRSRCLSTGEIVEPCESDSVTFFLAGISIECALELVAHKEASVARLTSSECRAMSWPLFTYSEPEKLDSISEAPKLIPFARSALQRHWVWKQLADRAEFASSYPDANPSYQWMNSFHSGNKCTFMLYTMDLNGYRRLFTGRLIPEGNESHVSRVCTEMCRIMHEMFPQIISRPESYIKGSNLHKGGGTSSQVMGLPEINDLAIHERTLVLEKVTRLQEPFASKVMDVLGIPRVNLIDSMRLAEFSSRITYLSVSKWFSPKSGENQSIESSSAESKKYLDRVVKEHGHMSVLDSFRFQFSDPLNRFDNRQLTFTLKQLMQQYCKFPHVMKSLKDAEQFMF